MYFGESTNYSEEYLDENYIFISSEAKKIKSDIKEIINNIFDK